MKGVEFCRTAGREDDTEMMDDVKTILQTCQNLTDFTFLPYKATTFEPGIRPGQHQQEVGVNSDLIYFQRGAKY